MTALNKDWQVTTFVQVAKATADGSYVPISPDYPEIKDLVERGYIKANKRLHNKDGLVAFVSVKGADAADLLIDLGYASNNPHLITLVSQDVIDVMTQLEQSTTTAAPAAPHVEVAPQPAVAPAPTPVAAPVAEAAPVAPHVTPVVPAVEAAPAPMPAPVVQQSFVAQQPAATTGGIDLDVAFDAPKFENYDYAGLAAAKQANPSAHPSIWVGKKSKDLSSQVKAAAQHYEQSVGITFRVRAVKATDPKGAGSRIYALTVAEAPPRKEFGGRTTKAE